METDDVTPLNDEGWDGVVGVYMRRGLTDAQFRTLHPAYMGPVGSEHRRWTRSSLGGTRPSRGV
jgi:hypothetical protein